MTTRPPVVYLPGIDGTGRLLFRQERLRAEYAVRAVSYPQDDRHTYTDLVECALRVLQETGPAAVIAESFGGAVGILTALARPDLVQRLILMNTFAYYPRRLFIDVAGWVGPWLPRRPSHPATRRVRELFFFGPNATRADRDFWWKQTADVPMRVYGYRCRLLRDLDLRPRLSEVRTPALVFVAPNDRVVPAPAGRLLARLLPRATRIEIPTCHAALVDPRVNIAEWLADPDLWR
jgi:pimeloyl-ACP methyl ester carboxylesterase